MLLFSKRNLCVLSQCLFKRWTDTKRLTIIFAENCINLLSISKLLGHEMSPCDITQGAMSITFQRGPLAHPHNLWKPNNFLPFKIFNQQSISPSLTFQVQIKQTICDPYQCHHWFRWLTLQVTWLCNVHFKLDSGAFDDLLLQSSPHGNGFWCTEIGQYIKSHILISWSINHVHLSICNYCDNFFLFLFVFDIQFPFLQWFFQQVHQFGTGCFRLVSISEFQFQHTHTPSRNGENFNNKKRMFPFAYDKRFIIFFLGKLSLSLWQDEYF